MNSDLIETKSFYKTKTTGELSLKIMKIALSVCKALEFAHINGVMHLNLKPSNILEMIGMYHYN